MRAAGAEGVCALESAQFHTCLVLSELAVKDLRGSQPVVGCREEIGGNGTVVGVTEEPRVFRLSVEAASFPLGQEVNPSPPR